MSLVLYETVDHVTTITLNRPEAHNAINGAVRDELNGAWAAFRDDEDAWVAILTGTDPVFCAGADLKDGAGSVGTFAYPEVGIGTPTIVGAIRLPDRIRWADAMELLLTGEPMSAERAAEVGLVWRLVDHDDLLAEARAWATTLTRAAPLAQRATKEVAWRSRNLGWIEAVRFGETMRKVAAATDDDAEGRAAWAEKRRPEWRGR